ncbi:MAG: TldD/PmbA family protein [bacterium]
MIKYIKAKLDKIGSVDYASICAHENKVCSISFSGKELENIGTHQGFGGNIRVCHKGGWGFVSFNDLSDIDKNIKTACMHAGLIGNSRTVLSPLTPVREYIKASVECDPGTLSLEEKEALTRKYNTMILGNSRIQTSSVRYQDSFTRKHFVCTDGSVITQEIIRTGIMFMASARDGTNIQSVFSSYGDNKGFEIVRNLEDLVEKAVKDVLDQLSAPKVTGGRYTVILDPELAGVFAHEAFGHMSEADFIYDNPPWKEKMKLGARFGVENLNIVDDAGIPSARGSYAYDDEGFPAQKTYLLKNGILNARLHSRETAGKMGENPTGNARAINYNFQPIVRMSCTYIEPDNHGNSFEEMVSGIDKGIYAVGMQGGNTDLEMYTFSAKKGFLIKNGKIDCLVRDVVLTGNLFETLHNIDAIGNDFKLYGGLGGCGKGGQSPLPVSDGGPHIRVKNVLIG